MHSYTNGIPDCTSACAECQSQVPHSPLSFLEVWLGSRHYSGEPFTPGEYTEGMPSKSPPIHKSEG